MNVHCQVTDVDIPINDAILCTIGAWRGCYVTWCYARYRQIDGVIGWCTMFDKIKQTWTK